MLVGSGNTKDAMSEQSYRLLIVEDDPGLLSQLRWCFEDYDVCTAAARESAIAELRRHEPAVVLPSVVGVNASRSSSLPETPDTPTDPDVETKIRPSSSRLAGPSAAPPSPCVSSMTSSVGRR